MTIRNLICQQKHDRNKTKTRIFHFSELYLAMLINREFMKLLMKIIRIQTLQVSSIIK